MARTEPAADPASTLAQAPVFAGLGEAALRDLAGDAELHSLRSGDRLYAEGDLSAYCYLVVSGRLRVTAAGKLVGYVGRLEPVGEMGAITGESRTSDVHAVRDSAVLRIENAAFLDFLEREPAALLAFSRLAIERLREQGRTRMLAATELEGTFAVIPASADVPVTALAEALVRRLSGWPAARLVTAAHVDAALGEGTAQTPLGGGERDARLTTWLGELEGRHQYLVFAADAGDDAWALRCLHHADRVLILAEASQSPAPVPVLNELRDHSVLAQIELVLLRPDGDRSPHTAAWLEQTAARAHYFVHPWDEADLASLARQVTGRGVGLVLGGGGARGFAHIGLVRALEQLGIPVDVSGGTSMGAFVAAMLAIGLDSTEMAQVARETFISNRYLNDYALPRVSLIRARKFAGRLEEIFGDRQIEDLRRTCFCVSTNLTTGETVVHDRGPLYAWVGTSMAVPGVAPPVAYHEDLLCDGGLVDNLPTDVMQALERGSIIACNVGAEGGIGAPGAGIDGPDAEAMLGWRGGAGPPLLGEILVRSAMLNSAAAVERAAERADVYLRMPTGEFGMFDWKRLDALIALGYEHAIEHVGPVADTLVR